MKKEPKDDFDACQEFFTLIVHSHVLCAAMEVLQMDGLNSMPESKFLVSDVPRKPKQEKEKIILSIAQTIISKTVDLSMSYKTDLPQDDREDHIYEYASEAISLGLLFLNYRDVIKEGDGERIILCWKYYLILFKATNRRNYAIEAFHTLASINILPPRLAHHLIWSRTISTHTDGKPGHNMPCDLYIEHINQLLKQCIHNLHANKTEKAIHVASKSMGPVNSIIQNFDQKYSLFSDQMPTQYVAVPLTMM